MFRESDCVAELEIVILRFFSMMNKDILHQNDKMLVRDLGTSFFIVLKKGVQSFKRLICLGLFL